MAKEDIYQLSKHIADFIEASMCPYNIDQPIYSLRCFDEKLLMDFLEKHNLIDITSSQQREYGVSSYILEIPSKCYDNLSLKKNVGSCKIRFLYGNYNDKTEFLAIPFVLIGEMDNIELDVAFSHYDNEQVNKFIYNANDKIIRENKLKILHYILSAQLMDAFIHSNEITDSRRLDRNDDFVFSKNILQMTSESDNPFNFNSVDICNDICYDYDFKYNEYLNHTFDFLYSDRMYYTDYCDSDDEIITSELLILSNLKAYISSVMEIELDSLIFTNVIDTLIDKGFIIPSIVHGINKQSIIRAYKCGEVYALNQQHFQLFSYSLYEYSKITNDNKLHKTELEKLCVLFFREAVNRRILKCKEAAEGQDEFSICYSKFGPRVSSSRDELDASEKSPLAAKLLNDNFIIENDANYYEPVEILKEGIENRTWVQIARGFSRKYGKLYTSLFKGEKKETLFDEIRDMYMRNYLEFLTMLSIGLNNIEQLKSLLAEIRLYDLTKTTGDIRTILTNCTRILDGLVSGMWKYMCYSQDEHPLMKVYNKLEASSNTDDLCSYFEDSIFSHNPDIDKNEHIKPMIDETGKLIFSIAYSIWFMLKKYNINWYVRGKTINLEQSYTREFYYRDLSAFRKSIEEMVKYNSTEQDMLLLGMLQSGSRNLISRYRSEIAEGKKHKKKNDAGNDNNADIKDVNNNNFNIVINAAPGAIINIGKISFQTISNDLPEKLNQLLPHVDNTDKDAIISAIYAAKNKNEKAFVKAMKLVGKSTLKIVESVLGSIISGYLRQHGII